ncbi:hypothetical protein [Plantactinospora sp. CA-290183]|uniref:hypothetical protein n=1 Tax=Plantactinospora sp. CA-290183 TaxID=3240006 RepID=UPI003D8F2554
MDMPDEALSVAVEALRSDARAWQETADVTRRAATESSGLDLGLAELSWAAEGDLFVTYMMIQHKVEHLLGQAGSTLRDLANVLEEIADSYESSDSAAAARYDNLWEPA